MNPMFLLGLGDSNSSLGGLIFVIFLIVLFLAWPHRNKVPKGKTIEHNRENCPEYPVAISRYTGGAYGCQQCIIEDELERIKMGLPIE